MGMRVKSTKRKLDVLIGSAKVPDLSTCLSTNCTIPKGCCGMQ